MEQIPIQQVAAGENHTLALSRSGQVFSWGANSFGQLGHSLKSCTQQSRMTPKRIDAFRGRFMTSIAVSGCHSAAICGDDNAVYTWGSNKKGQLGRKEGFGTDQAYPAPKSVDALLAHHPVSAIYEEYDSVKPIQVALSDSHTSVVLKCSRNEQSHGQVWQFGYGSNYPMRVSFKEKSRAGSVLMSDVWVPSWKQAAIDIVQISCAQNHSIALSACGSVYTWGHNGQALSHHKQREFVLPGAPQKVSLAKYGRIASICASQDHCAVVTADGNLITWGCGSQNVLGHGQGNTWQPNPKRVPGVRKAVSVATGHQHTAVLIAPYIPVFRVSESPSASSRVGSVPPLLSMLQQLVAQHMELSNCVTLWKYASALGTTSLENYTFEFIRMNWDAILEMVGGRERIDFLFELILPPMDKMKLKVLKKNVVAVEPVAQPSPVLTALRDFTADKRAEKKVKVVPNSQGAVVESDADKPSSCPITLRISEEHAQAAVPARVLRKKAAKFISLDAFLGQKKREDTDVQPKKRDIAPVAQDIASPWKTGLSNNNAAHFSPSPARPTGMHDLNDGFSIGKPRSSRRGNDDQTAATPPLPPSRRKSSIGSSNIPASPSLTAFSLPPAAAQSKSLLAQDGSERQLLSTFSLDAFMKKPSRNGRKKGVLAEPVEEAKPSWSAAAAPLVKAPAKTLKEIQQEEEARVAAEAAAKARNGGFVRRASTVNSWGLCEAQSHVSFAELQQIQEQQEFLEQQRQILAQIEMERDALRKQKQEPQHPVNQQQIGGGPKRTSKAKKAKDAPKKKPLETAGAPMEHTPSKASKKKKKQQVESEADLKTSKASRKKQQQARPRPAVQASNGVSAA